MTWTRADLAVGQLATYLESFILKDTFDGSVFTTWRQLRLEDDTERSVAHDLALCVLHLPRLPGEPVLHLLTNHVYTELSAALVAISEYTHHPSVDW